MDISLMRKSGLWVLLLATLYLVFDTSRQQDESNAVSEPVDVDNRQRNLASSIDGAPASGLPQRVWGEESASDPFRITAWYTAPRPRQEAPPPPVAPPLPFIYFGKMAEGEQPYAFLQNGRAVQVVKPGDVLDNKYRVESITSKAVTFVYLPLNATQVAVLGAKPAVMLQLEQNVKPVSAEDADTVNEIKPLSMTPGNGDVQSTGVAETGNSQEQ